MQAAEKTAPHQLSVGDKAPMFDMPTNGGGNISLASLAGKNTVLYFYPKDDPPGCTIEAKDFRDNISEFEKLGAVVIGASKDPVKSHDKFQEKYCLPFPLASAENTSVCEDYGVWKEKTNYGKTYMGIERTTFLIDKSGIIRQIWRRVKVDGHVSEVLKAVKGL
jgi:peroxiredoxin Q/BCP